MSGKGCGRHSNLIIVSNLSGSSGQPLGRIDVKVNLLGPEAGFMTDDQPGFGVVLGDQKSESVSIPGGLKDEIRRLGLSRPERLGELPRRRAKAV